MFEELNKTRYIMSYDENRISGQIEGGLNRKEQQQLRDHFAGLAMQAEIIRNQSGYCPEHIAEFSYHVADTMLKARKENGND